MSEQPALYKRDLPKISDLYADKEMIIKDTQLAIILNSEPKQEWVKTHPMIKAKYIPIEIVEYLLTRIFGRWKVEIKESKLLANSVTCTVRLWYIDPISGEWEWQDGIGASPLQTDKEKGAVDFNFIKSGAVMMAAPAAESYAIKDAAEKLGKIFGKDLNRKDAIGYDSLQKVNNERGKLELKPGTGLWDSAVRALQIENITIDQIKERFDLSTENQQKLIDEAI